MVEKGGRKTAEFLLWHFVRTAFERQYSACKTDYPASKCNVLFFLYKFAKENGIAEGPDFPIFSDFLLIFFLSP